MITKLTTKYFDAVAITLGAASVITGIFLSVYFNPLLGGRIAIGGGCLILGGATFALIKHNRGHQAALDLLPYLSIAIAVSFVALFLFNLHTPRSRMITFIASAALLASCIYTLAKMHKIRKHYRTRSESLELYILASLKNDQTTMRSLENHFPDLKEKKFTPEICASVMKANSSLTEQFERHSPEYRAYVKARGNASAKQELAYTEATQGIEEAEAYERQLFS